MASKEDIEIQMRFEEAFKELVDFVPEDVDIHDFLQDMRNHKTEDPRLLLALDEFNKAWADVKKAMGDLENLGK